MIYLLIKCYFSILLPIIMGGLLIFILGLYLLLKKPRLVNLKLNDVLLKSNALNFAGKGLDKRKPIYQDQGIKKIEENFITPFSLPQKIVLDEINAGIQDVSSIAGEDPLATQLDLARAYIELGKKKYAKNILEYVKKQGNMAQQNEARALLGLI